MSSNGMRMTLARRLFAAAVPKVKVNTNEAANAANIRSVVRIAYSGSRHGSRLISVAPGVSIRTNVPRATCATEINVANTHRMAMRSQRLGSRLSAVNGGWFLVVIRL